MGFARLAENGIRSLRGKKEGEALGALDKIASSTVGGALATWNQPIEVVRVEVSEDVCCICASSLTIVFPRLDAICRQERQC